MKAVAAAVLVALTLPARADAAEAVVASVQPREFAPRVVAIPEGSGLRFVQADPLALHDLVSTDPGEGGLPLFGTARTLFFGEHEEVLRVDALPPGEYPFTCTLHLWMYGTLVVLET